MRWDEIWKQLRRARNEIRKPNDDKRWEKTWNQSKRWRGETWKKKKMRPERQAVTNEQRLEWKTLEKHQGEKIRDEK